MSINTKGTSPLVLSLQMISDVFVSHCKASRLYYFAVSTVTFINTNIGTKLSSVWHLVFSSILLVSCCLLTSPCACYCHILDVLAKQLFGLISLCLVKTAPHCCLMYECWSLVGGGASEASLYTHQRSLLVTSRLLQCTAIGGSCWQSDQQIAMHWHSNSPPAAHNASWWSVISASRRRD